MTDKSPTRNPVRCSNCETVQRCHLLPDATSTPLCDFCAIEHMSKTITRLVDEVARLSAAPE